MNIIHDQSHRKLFAYDTDNKPSVFSLRKFTKLLFLVGPALLAAQVANASPVFDVSCPISEDLNSMHTSISLWNKELDSEAIDRNLSKYAKIIATLENKKLAPTKSQLEKIKAQLEFSQKCLEKTFRKFTKKAQTELVQLNSNWIKIRDRLVKKLSKKEPKISASDFVRGIEFLDHLSAVNGEYTDSFEFLKLQKRYIPKRIKRIFKQSIKNHLEELEKLATSTFMPAKATESLNNAVVKEWLSRAIYYRPNDTQYISDTQLIRLLHLVGFPINGPIENSHTALTLAAGLGKLSDTQMLLKLGYEPNQRNERGWPPYYLALEASRYSVSRILVDAGALPHHSYLCHKKVNEDLRAIKILRKSGLNPNLLHDGRNPLHWAAAWGHDESIEKLLDMGADPNIPDNEGVTPLCLYKYNNIKTPPKRLTEADLYAEETLASKLLGHVLEFGGRVKIKDREISITHSTSYLMFHHMLNIFREFIQEFPHEFSAQEVNKIEIFFNRANNIMYLDDMIEDLKLGNPGLFPTRFYYEDAGVKNNIHIWLAFIYDNKLVIANKGLASRKPIEMYDIDPALIDIPFLTDIANLRGTQEEDYLKWLNKITTRFKSKEIEVHYPFKSVQVAGNCAWESNETGFYAYLTLLRKNKSAVKSFKRFLKFAKFYAIRNFFNRVSAATIQQNPVLLENILKVIKKTKWPAKLKPHLKNYMN